MNRPGVRSRTFVWHFDSPPEAVWPILADTVRFNEAAGLPRYDIEETPQPDGSVTFTGRTRMGPFSLEWRDIPVEWVANRWFEHCREFRRGPLASLCARLELVPAESGCRADYSITAAPAGLLGRLILRGGFFESAGRTFGALAEDARRFAAGNRESPFRFTPPKTDPAIRRQVEAIVARIEDSGHGHGLAGRLAEHLLAAQEADLVHIRPLQLARAWGQPERAVIELCLEAARAGLLAMRWDLLCPRCRVTKAAVPALDELPKGAHCGTCNIDYDSDFSRNVELSFTPAPAVRPLGGGEFCLFGPMSTPHVLLQLRVPAGGTRRIEAPLAPGAYRLRTLEPGPEHDFEADNPFPDLVLGAEGFATEANSTGQGGVVLLHNRTNRDLTLVLEERAWVRDALTADRVTALQAFRDLFSDQVLRPGDEVALRRIALMFTDLRGSTALYDRIGDAAAYHLVREHFALLAGVVRRHDGALIKTIGDAIMAVFASPAAALEAALDVRKAIADFNRDHGGEGQDAIVIKIGLHEGPCIAVTLNGRLDYFGTTVNMAARLQGRSEGGDIVLSAGFAEDPAVAPRLAPLPHQREATSLKGFAEPVAFVRILP